MRDNRLLFGPLGAAILLLGVVGLGLMVPGYDAVRQTVSEIGEVGSPMRVPFAAMLCVVAGCILVFALGLNKIAVETRRSRWPAWLTGAMAISAAGVGLFAFPHPLHNVFGLSELVGYQAPLVLALTWRRDPRLARVAGLSAVMAVLVWLAIALNLSSLDRSGAIWAHLKPVNGLVQRALFAAWFGWCALLGARLHLSGKTAA
jgi:hypothetical membrane protein